MKKIFYLNVATVWFMVALLAFASALNAQQTKRNIVANSNFEDGLKHWRWDADLESSILFDVEDVNPISGDKSAKIQVLQQRTEPWEQTFYYYLPIEEYAKYKVSLKIRSDVEDATVRLELCQSEFGWGIEFKPIDLESWDGEFTPDNAGNPDLRGAIKAGTEVKEYSFITSGTQYGYPNYVFSFHFGHADIATYWIDDVKISRVDAGDWDGNLFPVGNFESERVRDGNNQGYYIDGRVPGDTKSIAELSTVDPIAGNKTFHIVKDADMPATNDYWQLSYHFQFWNNDVPKLDISFKGKSSVDCKIPMRLICNPWGWAVGDVIQWEIPLTTEVQEITLSESQAVNWWEKDVGRLYADADIPAYWWFGPAPHEGGFKGRMSIHGSLSDPFSVTQRGVEIWIDDLTIKEADLSLQSFDVEYAPDEVEIGKTAQFKIGEWVYPTHAPSTVVFRVEDGTGSATIDQNGVLTGVSEGEVDVYIDTPDETDEKHFVVLVIPAVEEPEPEIEHVYVKPMNISFGGGGYEGWNTLTGMRVNSEIQNLKDNEGNKTQASLIITESFNGINNNGPDATTTDMNLPQEVVKNNFFGNVGAFGDGVFPKATIKITGLYPDVEYDFEMFASRMDAVDNRETYFKFTGAAVEPETVYLNASNNTANTVKTSAFKPNEDGEVIMEIGPGPNNTNGSKFYHLSLMRITPHASVETIPFENKVNISFAHGPYDPAWNVLGDFRVDAAATNLRDINGKATEVNLVVTEAFNHINGDGATETETDMNMPLEASKWSYYGNSKTLWMDKIVEKSAVKFTGLEPNRKYDFEIYASRMGVGDNREAYYKFTGQAASETTVYLDASNNENNTAKLTGFVPDEDGEIAIEIGPGPNNDNGTGFYYIGAMTIKPGDIVGLHQTAVTKQAFPNPFADVLNVFVENEFSTAKIFSIDGSEVMSLDGLMPNAYNRIPTGLLQPGAYIIQSGTWRTVVIKK